MGVVVHRILDRGAEKLGERLGVALGVGAGDVERTGETYLGVAGVAGGVEDALVGRYADEALFVEEGHVPAAFADFPGLPTGRGDAGGAVGGADVAAAENQAPHSVGRGPEGASGE